MRILCFGDSNTYGYDPRGFGGRYGTGDRWVDRLEKLTGWQTVNTGLNGREIPRGPYTPPEHDLLLVMLGTNDLLQGASPAEAAARMASFLTRIRPVCKEPLLIAPPSMKRGAWVPSDALAAAAAQLAAEYRAVAEAQHIGFIDASGWDIPLAFDGVHFTEEGHQIFAQKIAESLKKCLTLPQRHGLS